MNRRIILVLSMLALLVIQTSSASALSTGFVPGQIWYSKDTLVAGDTVKIYTIVWNSQSSPINVRVEFYDKNTVLGARDVSLNAEQVKEVSVSWAVTAGDHAISAKIISSTQATGSSAPIVIENRTTAEDIKFVPAQNGVTKKQTESTPSAGLTIDDAFARTEDVVTKAIPPSIRNPIIRAFQSIEKFRIATHSRITKSIKDIRTKAEALTKGGRPKTDGTEAPLIKVKLFFFSILKFLFATRIVFYAVFAFLVLFVIRTIFHFLRDR